MLEKKVIDLTVWDVFLGFSVVYWGLFFSLIVMKHFTKKDYSNLPCEEIGNRTLSNLPVRCFDFYKVK